MITAQRSSFVQSAIASIALLVSIAMLAWISAYWIWHWLAPRPAARAMPTDVQLGNMVHAPQLFGQANRDVSGVAASSTPIKLLGVVAARTGHAGYAVLQLESRQVLAVREGQDFASGTRMIAVQADGVTIERAGLRERVLLPQRSLVAEPKPGSAPK